MTGVQTCALPIYDIALDMVNRIEKIQGTSAELSIQKSALHEELNQNNEALTVMYTALENDSINIMVLHRLVSLLLDQEKNEKATLINQKIIKHFPDDSRGYINDAVIAMSNQKPEEAILALSAHVGKFPQDFTVQYLLGTAYYQFKDYGNAEIYLSQALTIFPDSRNTKHNLAMIYDTTKEWVKSDKLYMDLIATDSTDAQAFNNYAYSLIERGEDVEFSLELAKQAIRLVPDSAPYLDTIGWIYFKMDQIDEAIKYIQNSLNIDSENSTIQDHLDYILKIKAELDTHKDPQVEKRD